MMTQQRIFETEPSLRIKIAESQDVIDLKPDGPFSIRNQAGETVFRHDAGSGYWRVSLEQHVTPQLIFYVIIERLRILSAAEERAKHLISDSYSAQVRPAVVKFI